MFTKFTGQARKVMELAQEEARRFKDGYLGTPHLVLGLLRENTSPASFILQAFHIDAAAVEQQIAENFSRGLDADVTGSLPFTPDLKKVLQSAAEEADRRGQSLVAPEHLLLGLLLDDENHAAAIVTKAGVQVDKLREVVLSLPGLQNTEIIAQPNLERVEPPARQLDAAFTTDPPAQGGCDRPLQTGLSLFREGGAGEYTFPEIGLPGAASVVDSSECWNAVCFGLRRMHSQVSQCPTGLVAGASIYLAAGVFAIFAGVGDLIHLFGFYFIIPIAGVLFTGSASMAGQVMCCKVPAESRLKVWVIGFVVFFSLGVIFFFGLLIVVLISKPWAIPVWVMTSERVFLWPLLIGLGTLTAIAASLSHVLFLLFLKGVARIFCNARLSQDGSVYLRLLFVSIGVAVGTAGFCAAQINPAFRTVVQVPMFLLILGFLGVTLQVLLFILLLKYARLLASTRDLIVVGSRPSS